MSLKLPKFEMHEPPHLGRATTNFIKSVDIGHKTNQASSIQYPVYSIWSARRALYSHRLFLLFFSFLMCCCLTSCAWLRHLGKEKKTIRMEVTAYCACKKCCGWKRKWGCCLMPPVYAYGQNKGKRKVVGIAADGTKAKMGTIAADTSLFPFGTQMYIPGYGWGVVHDRGRAIKGYHIDIFFDDHDDAMRWGRKWLDVVVIRK